MNTFNIHNVLEKGWQITKTHFWLFVRVLVVTWGMSFTSNFLSGVSKHAASPEVFVYGATSFGLGILSLLIQIGFLKMAFKMYKGETPEMSELLGYSSYFWKFLLTSICVGGVAFLSALVGGLVVGLLVAVLMYVTHSLAFLFLLVLIVIPVVYILLRYCFVQFLVIDKDMKIVDAFKKSAEMTDGNKAHLLALGLLLIVMNIIGALCIGVGLFVSIPVTTMTFVAVYKQLLGEGMPLATEITSVESPKELTEQPVKTITLEQ